MTSTYQTKILTKSVQHVLAGLLIFVCTYGTVRAQVTVPDSLSLSVTPTLFQMSASPTQIWNSSVKVINNNPRELTVFAKVVNFAPQGETGAGKFLPVFDDARDGSSLAEWISISTDAITIAPEASFNIPFTVSVPEDATPGGHFAAILISTKPPISDGESIKVATSQVVTSLFFVRIAGDVIEDGSVREFHVAKTFVNLPKADFEVRFENKGNVQLQPQGEIVITNMWGKERGTIPINQQTHFGNVLPNSIRKFEFSWKGEQSFSDIGRYKVALTLAYGEDARKFVTNTDYFYVVPVKAGAITLSLVLLFIFIVRWSIKAYVRKMLLLAGVEPDLSQRELVQRRSFVKEGDIRISKAVSLKAPMQSGYSDLRDRFIKTPAFFGKIKALYSFTVAYKRFFIALCVILFCLCVLVIFIHNAQKEQRDYEVVIHNADTKIKLSSEDILYTKKQTDDQARSFLETDASTTTQQQYEIVLVNSSDTPGLAASLQTLLQSKGYTITDLQSDFEKSKPKTVIVYDTSLQNEALTLSKYINNALLSARPLQSTSSPLITIYIGNDFISL